MKQNNNLNKKNDQKDNNFQKFINIFYIFEHSNIRIHKKIHIGQLMKKY